MKQTFKLLTLNQSWADEHNVPAFACFTEEEYENWCKSLMGKVNENYVAELIAYENQLEKYNAFHNGMIEKQLYNKALSQYTTEEKQWFEKNKTTRYFDSPEKIRSYVTAYLGNGGDGFGDCYSDYATGQDFLNANIVKVFDVSEDFYNTFKLANLADLSLSNIFTLTDIDREEFDEDYED